MYVRSSGSSKYEIQAESRGTHHSPSSTSQHACYQSLSTLVLWEILGSSMYITFCILQIPSHKTSSPPRHKSPTRPTTFQVSVYSTIPALSRHRVSILSHLSSVRVTFASCFGRVSCLASAILGAVMTDHHQAIPRHCTPRSLTSFDPSPLGTRNAQFRINSISTHQSSFILI
jgi:hypothetical protein